MKLFLIPALAGALLLSGCATSQVEHYLGPPAQVQADVTYLGGRAKQYLSAENQAKLHNFAVQLNAASNADIGPLLALLPTDTGSMAGNILLNMAKMTLSLVVQLYAHNNGTLLSYFHAVSAGLLANFP